MSFVINDKQQASQGRAHSRKNENKIYDELAHEQPLLITALTIPIINDHMQHKKCMSKSFS